MITEIKHQITAKIAEYEKAKKNAETVQMSLMWSNQIIGLKEALEIIETEENVQAAGEEFKNKIKQI